MPACEECPGADFELAHPVAVGAGESGFLVVRAIRVGSILPVCTVPGGRLTSTAGALPGRPPQLARSIRDRRAVVGLGGPRGLGALGASDSARDSLQPREQILSRPLALFGDLDPALGEALLVSRDDLFQPGEDLGLLAKARETPKGGDHRRDPPAAATVSVA